MENCDDHGGGEQGLEEVWQLSGSVTVIREVWKVLKMSVSLWRGIMVMWEVKTGVDMGDSCQYIEGWFDIYFGCEFKKIS